MAKKKKNSGHYCRICGEYKANEKSALKMLTNDIVQEYWIEKPSDTFF